MRLQVTGTRGVINALATYRGPQLRRVIFRTARKVMQQTLADAKANTPVVSGRLRASLKIHELSRFRLSQGEAGVAIYPSNEFTFGRGSAKRAVVRSKRSRAKAAARGIATDETSPWLYAHIVETGMTRKGVSRQQPRHYLLRAIESNKERMVSDFAAQISTTLPKSGGH